MSLLFRVYYTANTLSSFPNNVLFSPLGKKGVKRTNLNKRVPHITRVPPKLDDDDDDDDALVVDDDPKPRLETKNAAASFFFFFFFDALVNAFFTLRVLWN